MPPSAPHVVVLGVEVLLAVEEARDVVAMLFDLHCVPRARLDLGFGALDSVATA